MSLLSPSSRSSRSLQSRSTCHCAWQSLLAQTAEPDGEANSAMRHASRSRFARQAKPRGAPHGSNADLGVQLTMRAALLLLCSLLIVGHVRAADPEVSVFISTRSALVPRSGKVVLDIYWFNRTSKPKSIPNLESYSVSQSVFPRHGRSLPRFVGGTHTSLHRGPDRAIEALTMVRDELTIEVEITDEEFAEISAKFWNSRYRVFRSNTVILTKRR